MIKKLSRFVIVLLILQVICFNYYAVFAATTIPTISGEAAILIEENTGKVLYEKNSQQKMFPASTTKILTAIIALEKLDLNKQVTIPDGMGMANGSAMFLLPGEVFTVRQLLDAMLVKSANDAAEILAKETSGDILSFSKLMNEKAKSFGCTNSNFVNPSGLHEEEHYTTVNDMSIIAREAMKNPLFRELVAQVRVTLDETPQTPEKRYFLNTNRFLWDESKIIIDNEFIPIKYDVVNGIKTGYTPQAKSCLVSSGTKNDISMIAVVYKAEGFDVYRDSRLLLDYGFENFAIKKIISNEIPIDKIEMPKTVQKELFYYAKSDYSLVFDKGQDPSVDTTVALDELKLPVLAGEKVGKILIHNGETTDELEIFAAADLESIYTLKYFRQWAKENIVIISVIAIGIILLIIFILLIFKLSNRKKRKKRFLKKYNNLY